MKCLDKKLGRGKTGISPGAVLDCLRERVESMPGFDPRMSAAYHLNYAQGGYVPRTVLTPEQARVAIREAGVTMAQLYDSAECAECLAREDVQMMCCLHHLDDAGLAQILAVIRECQTPWWIPLMDTHEASAAERLQILTRRRLGCIWGSSEWEDRFPVLSRYTPFAKVFYIQTDDVPALARELDVHCCILTQLGCDLPWYSERLAVERVFAEYQMTSRSMRSMLLEYAQKRLEVSRIAR